MSHRVFFSFDYHDLWRANVVRNSAAIEGVMLVGIHDVADWEDAEKKGDNQLRKLIDSALDRSSVTIVLIGARTALRKYVSYEIDRSVALGKPIFGIRIDSIKDQSGTTDSRGPIPPGLAQAGAPVYDWEYGRLGGWIEKACR